ncbi:SPFH domain-containing protein [Vibrio splendidus]
MQFDGLLNIALYVVGFIFVCVVLSKCVKIIPNRSSYIIERFGAYTKTLEAGIHVIVPFIDVVAYKISMKERSVDVSSQEVITKDNIELVTDGVIYFQVVDAYKAAYGPEDYERSLVLLAKTTMRTELGKKELTEIFSEREMMNGSIRMSVNEPATAWGCDLKRFELLNVTPPSTLLSAMEKRVNADREKEAVILEAEGIQQAEILKADGEKQAMILKAEARKQAQILAAEGRKEEQSLEAQGEADAINQLATATSNQLSTVGASLKTEEGAAAMTFELGRLSISVNKNLARESTVMMLPSDSGSISQISSMVASAMAVSDTVKSHTSE